MHIRLYSCTSLYVKSGIIMNGTDEMADLCMSISPVIFTHEVFWQSLSESAVSIK